MHVNCWIYLDTNKSYLQIDNVFKTTIFFDNLSLQTAMYPLIILIGFLSNFLFAIILIIAGKYVYSFMVRNSSINKYPNPRCENSICHGLEKKMICLMKRRLEFQNCSDELENVRMHIRRMLNEVHKGPDEEVTNHAMFQCFRTNLVQDPDDLRGRRRANEARKIFINDVLQKRNCFYWLEFGLNFIYSRVVTCNSRLIQKWAKESFIVLGIMRKMLVFGLDVYSDLVIICTISIAIDLTNEIGAEIKNSLMKDCKIHEVPDKDIKFLNLAFRVYYTSLIATFVLSSLQQFCSNKLQEETGYKVEDFYKSKISEHTNCWKKLIIMLQCIIILIAEFTPIIHFWQLYKMQRSFIKSSNEDRKTKDRNWIVEKYLITKRYIGIIVEAFSESRPTCRLLLSFYFAFSYLVSTTKWAKADCIAKSILKDHQSIVTFGVYGWHNMPPLLFSSLTSILSITTAKILSYQIKHEYDMSMLGKLLYGLSVLCMVVAQLSCEIFLTSSLYVFVLDWNLGHWPTTLLILLFNYFINALPNNFKEFLVGYWRTQSKYAGYPLNLSYLPTTQPQIYAEKLIKPSQEIESYQKSRFWRKWFDFVDFVNKTSHEKKNKSWYIMSIFPFGGLEGRRIVCPEAYGFSSNGNRKSRFKFRERFAIGLGISKYII